MSAQANKKHLYGIATLLLGCLLSLNPYFLLFGVPVIILGIGLILASDVDTPSKLALSIIPPLVVVLFYCAVFFG